jgi:PDZ domain-containing protein
MAVNGDVGDVGGVAQKTVAVRNAGAVLFLVPPKELSVARAHAGPNMKVVAVSTIRQAISALEHVGGRLVTLPAK